MTQANKAFSHDLRVPDRPMAKGMDRGALYREGKCVVAVVDLQLTRKEGATLIGPRSPSGAAPDVKPRQEGERFDEWYFHGEPLYTFSHASVAATGAWRTRLVVPYSERTEGNLRRIARVAMEPMEGGLFAHPLLRGKHGRLVSEMAFAGFRTSAAEVAGRTMTSQFLTRQAMRLLLRTRAAGDGEERDQSVCEDLVQDGEPMSFEALRALATATEAVHGVAAAHEGRFRQVRVISHPGGSETHELHRDGTGPDDLRIVSRSLKPSEQPYGVMLSFKYQGLPTAETSLAKVWCTEPAYAIGTYARCGHSATGPERPWCGEVD